MWYLSQQDVTRPLVFDLVDVGHFRSDVVLVEVGRPVVEVDLLVSGHVVTERFRIRGPIM